VFASDSGRYIFDHWEDSNGNRLNHHATLRGVLVDSTTSLSLVAVYVDLGQNPIEINISQGSLVHLASGQALRIDITSIPGTPITIPIMLTGFTGSGLVSITLNGIVGTGFIIIYAEGVPDAAGHSVHLSGSTFTIGGTSTTGGIVLEIDTSAISFDSSVPNAITITVPYDHIAALNAGIPENTGHIKLFHFDGQNWVDITTSIDTINHTVTGQIDGGSASPVGAGYAPSSSNPGPIFTPQSSGGGGGGGGSSGPPVFISAPSEANPITVTTDKQSYSSGDTIHISGAVAKVVSGQGMFISITNPNGALYRADTIVPNSDGSYSYDLKIGGKLGPSGMYTVKVTYAQSSAQATFTFTNTTGGGMQTYTLNIDGKNYQIQYMITGGKLLNMTMDTGAKTLTANIDSTSNGTLTLVLPRSVIDSQENGKDIDFNVFADGVALGALPDQNTTADSRTLAINFDNGTQKIEVVGTNAVPEFGPIAALVLVIAIIGTIVATTRFRKSGFGFSSGNSLQ
jgi:predicted secreted protein with PEFG-CTERM motif